MQCPICKLDLTPLDLYSRQEHCELCLENGPSILEADETGRLVIKKRVPPGKQRRICPICDKTFQSLNAHFKTCAIKNDVPPHLMLEYWDKINSDIKNPKKFPRELLDNFVKKCVREGRVGDQVDFARALSLSIAESEPQTSSTSTSTAVGLTTELSDASAPQVAPAPNVNHVLMSSAATITNTNIVHVPKPANKKKFRLELVDDSMKRANILVRLDRELAATRSRRYEEALRASELNSDVQVIDENCDGDVEILEELKSCDNSELDKLFFRARLKDCTDSSDCSQGTCRGHDLMLLMEEFKPYAGASMDAAPSRRGDQTTNDVIETCEKNEAVTDGASEQQPLA